MEKTIHAIENARFVFNHKVILYQVSNGIVGTLTKFVEVVIIVEIGMIRVNNNLIAKEKIMPLLKPMVNSSKFLIVDILVGFSFGEGF
jgi:hypothetical protein